MSELLIGWAEETLVPEKKLPLRGRSQLNMRGWRNEPLPRRSKNAPAFLCA